ncbi:antibiotic resistance protein [Neorhizobium lilium]|uniref:Antibiotic resistance protein n=1 Tax=Neorhizobium lilium TaxID=2503024 RepID=A0A3S4UV32_9HYPH|nr:TfuA-like protein [Neorhizobium lilium]RWX81482.1 antibiotic resistance protein [Neorhizobium lilium]
MKIVFVGPTLPDVAGFVPAGIEIRGPAVHRDILNAVNQGVTTIGLIDGYFEDVAPVWHKEILFALSSGVRVYGSSSMGALRAAECAAFGMIGVGKIYAQYASGQMVDDSDVAQIHGPPEMKYLSLSEPLVNVLATLDHLLAKHELQGVEYSSLRASAEGLFFKDRTYRTVVANADLPEYPSRKRLEELLRANAVNQKRLDALELLDTIAAAENARQPAPMEWDFASTATWRKVL